MASGIVRRLSPIVAAIVAATQEACVGNCIRRIDVDQQAHRPDRRLLIVRKAEANAQALNSGGYQTGYRDRSRQPGFHHSTNSGSG